MLCCSSWINLVIMVSLNWKTSNFRRNLDLNDRYPLFSRILRAPKNGVIDNIFCLFVFCCKSCKKLVIGVVANRKMWNCDMQWTKIFFTAYMRQNYNSEREPWFKMGIYSIRTVLKSRKMDSIRIFRYIRVVSHFVPESYCKEGLFCSFQRYQVEKLTLEFCYISNTIIASFAIRCGDQVFLYQNHMPDPMVLFKKRFDNFPACYELIYYTLKSHVCTEAKLVFTVTLRF